MWYEQADTMRGQLIESVLTMCDQNWSNHPSPAMLKDFTDSLKMDGFEFEDLPLLIAPDATTYQLYATYRPEDPEPEPETFNVDLSVLLPHGKVYKQRRLVIATNDDYNGEPYVYALGRFGEWILAETVKRPSHPARYAMLHAGSRKGKALVGTNKKDAIEITKYLNSTNATADNFYEKVMEYWNRPSN